MALSVSARSAQRDFDDLLRLVHETNQSVIVERDGRPFAVLISPEKYSRLDEEQAAEDWAVIHEMQERNADLDPDEVLREVTEIVEQVRQEMFEEEQRATQSGR